MIPAKVEYKTIPRLNDTKTQEVFLMRRSTGDHRVPERMYGHRPAGADADKAHREDQHRGDDGQGGRGALHLLPLLQEQGRGAVLKIHCLWKRFCEAQARPADGPQDDTRMFFQFSLSLRPINDLLYAAGHQNALLEAYMQILDPSCQQSNIKTYYLNNFLPTGCSDW